MSTICTACGGTGGEGFFSSNYGLPIGVCSYCGGNGISSFPPVLNNNNPYPPLDPLDLELDIQACKWQRQMARDAAAYRDKYEHHF